MGDHIISNIVTIATAIVGVAIIAVLVSTKANTANVITSATKGFGTIISDAVSPVTGGSLSSPISSAL